MAPPTSRVAAERPKCMATRKPTPIPTAPPMNDTSNSRANYWQVAWDEWKEHPLTGTGAGTFMYTWLENRPGFGGVKQVHNVYLEQGTETGIGAFLALTSFAAL